MCARRYREELSLQNALSSELPVRAWEGGERPLECSLCMEEARAAHRASGATVQHASSCPPSGEQRREHPPAALRPRLPHQVHRQVVCRAARSNAGPSQPRAEPATHRHWAPRRRSSLPKALHCPSGAAPPLPAVQRRPAHRPDQWGRCHREHRRGHRRRWRRERISLGHGPRRARDRARLARAARRSARAARRSARAAAQPLRLSRSAPVGVAHCRRRTDCARPCRALGHELGSGGGASCGTVGGLHVVACM